MLSRLGGVPGASTAAAGAAGAFGAVPDPKAGGARPAAAAAAGGKASAKLGKLTLGNLAPAKNTEQALRAYYSKFGARNRACSRDRHS